MISKYLTKNIFQINLVHIFGIFCLYVCSFLVTLLMAFCSTTEAFLFLIYKAHILFTVTEVDLKMTVADNNTRNMAQTWMLVFLFQREMSNCRYSARKETCIKRVKIILLLRASLVLLIWLLKHMLNRYSSFIHLIS